MQLDEFIKQTEEDFATAVQILKNKNHDYANDKNVFSNFYESGNFAGITPVQSCMVLIGVKVSRLHVLVGTNKKANNESVDDTILDLVNYLMILKPLRAEYEKISL